jgi:hypothetical protein
MLTYHPEFYELSNELLKWRYTYEGGRSFIDQYLEKFSARESDTDFLNRKSISYCPRFAGAGIDEVKNSIYQRITDVTRLGGSESYQSSINGEQGGIDRKGNTANSFIGCELLTELLVMGRVGIYVDAPPISEFNATPRPYVYIYKRENIVNWVKDPVDPFRYQSVLLRDFSYDLDPDTRFPTDTVEKYRHLWLEDNRVYVQFYDETYSPELPEPLLLDIPVIPFICVEITTSLMKSIADYQIALLNLASSDLYYSLKSNFPFYTEQYDQNALASPYLKDNASADDAGTTDEELARSKEIIIGTATGRAYPIGTNRPEFIAPPSEPLLASMKKQEQLKEEIRLLLNLTIANLRPQRATAESKASDNQTLEAGLSYIGLTLETTEKRIAEIWDTYENKNQIATIKYPQEYSLKTDAERREEVSALDELRPTIPSLTFQKEVSKVMAKTLLGSKVSRQTLLDIENEINSLPAVVGDPDSIRQDVEAGLLDTELGSRLRLYPVGTAEKAKQDHADRLARIQAAQVSMSGARGTDTEQTSGREEKEASRNTDNKDTTAERTRGKGR